MSYRALTRIVQGDKKGRVVFRPGAELDESRFTEDQLDELVEAGAAELTEEEEDEVEEVTPPPPAPSA